jgi:hypothetical protein
MRRWLITILLCTASVPRNVLRLRRQLREPRHDFPALALAELLEMLLLLRLLLLRRKEQLRRRHLRLDVLQVLLQDAHALLKLDAVILHRVQLRRLLRDVRVLLPVFLVRPGRQDVVKADHWVGHDASCPYVTPANRRSVFLEVRGKFESPH